MESKPCKYFSVPPYNFSSHSQICVCGGQRQAPKDDAARRWRRLRSRCWCDGGCDNGSSRSGTVVVYCGNVIDAAMAMAMEAKARGRRRGGEGARGRCRRGEGAMVVASVEYERQYITNVCTQKSLQLYELRSHLAGLSLQA